MVSSVRRALLVAALLFSAVAPAHALETRAVAGVTANDIVYDKNGQKLYASVSGSAANYPNSVVEIDVATAMVVRSTWVGSEPNVLALSDDGSYLYVGLDGSNSVRRVALSSLTAGLEFSVASPTSPTTRAIDLAVMPGSPRTLAVVTQIGMHGSVRVYDDGTLRPVVAAGGLVQFGYYSVAFGVDGTRVFASRDGFIDVLAVTQSGVTAVATTRAPCGAQIRVGGGRASCASWFMDTATLYPAGRLAEGLSVSVADPDNGVVYGLASSGALVAFDWSTQRLLWRLPVPGLSLADITLTSEGVAVLTNPGRIPTLIDLSRSAPIALSSAGFGQGLVGATSPSFSCGLDCSRLMDVGSSVTLTATPAPGSTFVAWAGDPDCADGTVTMDAAKSCTAVFDGLSNPAGPVLRMATKDLVFSRLTERVYASVSGLDVMHGNTIVEIDPITGEVGRSVAVGSEPGRLALSDDGISLYVSLPSASAVARVDVSRMAVVGRFHLEDATLPGGVYAVYAGDLAVVPGDPDSVAVVRRNSMSSSDDGVAIYTNGVKKPVALAGPYGPRSLTFSASPTRLYCYGYEFLRLNVGPAGVSLLEQTYDLLDGNNNVIHFDGGRVFADGGEVVDPEVRVLLGRMPWAGRGVTVRIAPETQAGVIWAASFLSSGFVVQQYDAQRFTLREEVTVLGHAKFVSSVVVAGRNRVAVRAGWSPEPEYVVFVPFDTPSTFPVSVESANPTAGVEVEVSPVDLGGLGAGTTPFQRTFSPATKFQVTAPATVGDASFSRWLRDGRPYATTRSLALTALSAWTFTAVYLDPAPVVAAVSPSSGTAAGGTPVTITGLHFQPGASMTVGGVAATQVVVVDESTITARTPAGVVGVRAVSVRNPDDQAATLTAGFTYVDVPGYFAKSFPASAATGSPGVTVLSWDVAGRTQRYEYCVDSTINATCDATWTSTGLVPRAFVGVLSALTTYEWQVRAVGVSGFTDADGGWWTFTVAADPGCLPGTRSVLAKPTGSGLAGMWQATGVTAQAGRTLSLLPAAAGTWSNAGVAWSADGNAADVLTQTENAPRSGAPRMALVGRIGATGTPFLVGRGYQAPVSTTGEIFLAPNDYWYQTSDNSGSLAVTVCPGETPCSVDATATVPANAETAQAVTFASTAAATGCAGSPTFVWVFGDGATSAEPSPTHTYAAAGTFTWTLTVQAGTATATRTGTIVVREPGACIPSTHSILGKPSGSGVAGMWQATGVTVQAGESVTLDAVGQTWTNGGRAWTAAGDAADVLTQGENAPMGNAPRMALVGRIGASGTPFVVGTTRQVTASATGPLYLAPNDYWYLLWDNAGSLSVSACVGAAPCSVQATATVPTTGTPAVPVSFAATATAGTSCTGSPTFAWDFGDGGTSTAQNPAHTYAAAGTYTWTLTVHVGSATDTRTGTITVSDVGSCVPTTRAVLAKPTGSGVAGMWQATGQTVRAGESLTLSVSAGQTWTNGGRAWTADGDAADVLTQGENSPLRNAPRMALAGRIGTSGTPFLVGVQKQLTASSAGELYLAPNDYWYLLWDNAGLLNVSVCAGAAPCSVEATATVPATGAPATPLSFAATATATSCASAPTYEWDFGDGALLSTEQNPTHTYATAGTYTWTLTVRAGTATATRTGTITIRDAGSCTPTTHVVLAKPTGSGLAVMWQASGVMVTAGDALAISVAGTQTWTNGGRAWTADGDAADVLTQATNCPLANAPRMALIGRIGATGTPFLIGSQKDLVAAATGELYLAPNDYWYWLWDNVGSLTVTVCK
jgi:PKD repeat protein